MESCDNNNRSRHHRKVTSIGMDRGSEQVMATYENCHMPVHTLCLVIEVHHGLIFGALSCYFLQEVL